MNLNTKPFYNHGKLFLLLGIAFAVVLAGLLLKFSRQKYEELTLEEENSNLLLQYKEHDSMINATAPSTRRKTRRKEYLYRLLTNTTRSLIQMEIKARRLQENMRRIKEKTADLLWKNKDKALWHILFKNISKHITIRHEFHHHASLKRIMSDGEHSHKNFKRNRRYLF